MTNWSKEKYKCGMTLLHSEEGRDLYCSVCWEAGKKEYYPDSNYDAESEAERRFGA